MFDIQFWCSTLQRIIGIVFRPNWFEKLTLRKTNYSQNVALKIFCSYHNISNEVSKLLGVPSNKTPEFDIDSFYQHLK